VFTQQKKKQQQQQQTNKQTKSSSRDKNFSQKFTPPYKHRLFHVMYLNHVGAHLLRKNVQK